MEIFGFIVLMLIGVILALVGIYYCWITASFIGGIDYLGIFFILAGAFIVAWGSLHSPFKIVMETQTYKVES